MISGDHRFLTPGFALAADALLIALAGWVAYYLRWDSWQVDKSYLAALVVGTLLAMACLPAGGAYRSWRGRWQWDDFGNALPGLMAVVALLVLLGAATKTTADFSRLWMGYWFILAALALYGYRWLVRRALKHGALAGLSRRKVLIVGDGELAGSTAGRILDKGSSEFELAGFVSTGELNPDCERVAPILGSIENLAGIVESLGEDLDELWLAVSDSSVAFQGPVLQVLRSSCVTVRYVPDLSMAALLSHVPVEIAGMTVIDLNASPLSGHNAVLKDLFDKLFSLAVLLLITPLMLVIALLIKFDSPGPVLFRQRRHGWDGKIINILKFRTMVQVDEPGQERQATRNDPRLTRVGAFLRRTSLDELPQFFNVLGGDMSVVGPRPHPVALNESFLQQIDVYMQRHRVKPGITGWAQVNGLRGETDTLDKMQKRVEYDLFYIEHWSLWLDMKIIIRTLASSWKDENAY